MSGGAQPRLAAADGGAAGATHQAFAAGQRHLYRTLKAIAARFYRVGLCKFSPKRQYPCDSYVVVRPPIPDNRRLLFLGIAMTEYLLLFVGTVLVNNFVLVKVSWPVPVPRHVSKAGKRHRHGNGHYLRHDAGLRQHWVINTFILVPLDLVYLRTLLHSGDRRRRAVHRDGGAQPARRSTACWDLPAADHHQLRGTRRSVGNVNLGYNFLQSAVYGFSAAAGFSLVMVLFAAIRERGGRRRAGAVPRLLDRADHRRADVAGLYGLYRAGEILMTACWIAIAALSALGLLFRTGAGLRRAPFEVEEDPVAEQVDAILPQSQCGQCGYPVAAPTPRRWPTAR